MTPTAPSPGLGEREAVARILDSEASRFGHADYYGPEMDRSCYSARLRCALKTADRIIAEHIDPLRIENETLRAEREQSEKHRNDLMDSIVSLKTERGALRTRLAAAEAKLDAAIAKLKSANSD